MTPDAILKAELNEHGFLREIAYQLALLNEGLIKGFRVNSDQYNDKEYTIKLQVKR